MADIQPTVDPTTDDQTSTPDPKSGASTAPQGNQDTTADPDGGSTDTSNQSTTPASDEVPETPTADQELQQLLADRKKADNDRWSAVGRDRSKLEETVQAQQARIDQLEQVITNSQSTNPAETVPGDEQYKIYDGIPGIDQLDPAATELAERQHREMQRAKAEMAAEVEKVKKEFEEKERQREQENQINSQYNYYSQSHGMSKDAFDAMHEARQAGDHATADKILLLSTQSQEQLRQDAAAQAEQNLTNSFSVGGGSSNGNLAGQSSPQDSIQAEVDKMNAMPSKERNLYISDNFADWSPGMREALVRVKP